MSAKFVAFNLKRKLSFINNFSVERYLNELEDGCKLTIEIKPYYRKVTASQMNMAYMYSKIIADHIGDDYRSVAQALKAKYGLHEEKTDRKGNIVTFAFNADIHIVYVLSLFSDYNTKEMSEFLDKVYSYITNDLKIWMPDKKEVNIYQF